MISEHELELKYGIVFVGKQRYYRQDLSKKDYFLEFATPYSLEINGKSFINSSWKQMMIEVFTYLINTDNSKINILLEYKAPWNGKKQFSNEAGNFCEPIGDEIYLYCNQTALHACWLLMEVLTIFDVDLSKCEFVVHRPPSAEPSECREYFEKQTKKSFRFYYMNLLKNSEEKTFKVMNILETLNTYMPKVSKAYNNLFLFDNLASYSNYKNLLLKYIGEKSFSNKKNVEVASKCLTILGDFYKEIY